MNPELTNYQQFQLERFGNILPEPVILPSGQVIENGFEEMERFSQWMQEQAEQQLLEYEQ